MLFEICESFSWSWNLNSWAVCVVYVPCRKIILRPLCMDVSMMLTILWSVMLPSGGVRCWLSRRTCACVSYMDRNISIVIPAALYYSLHRKMSTDVTMSDAGFICSRCSIWASYWLLWNKLPVTVENPDIFFGIFVNNFSQLGVKRWLTAWHGSFLVMLAHVWWFASEACNRSMLKTFW
jgi:hypothetical protein